MMKLLATTIQRNIITPTVAAFKSPLVSTKVLLALFAAFVSIFSACMKMKHTKIVDVNFKTTNPRRLELTTPINNGLSSTAPK